jgi:hypothetical protein
MEIFIAACVSSFAFYFADKGDMKIIALIVYPRACEAVYTLLKEKGYARPVFKGEYLLHMITLNIITYFFSFEPYNIEKSTERSFDLYMQGSKEEY